MDNKKNQFNLVDYLTLNIAVSADEGDKIYRLLKDFLLKFKEKDSEDLIAINFEGIDLINTAFLNAAIGQLYADFDSDFLNKHLIIENINPNDVIYLKKTIESAIEYYKNPEQFNDDVSKIMNNG